MTRVLRSATNKCQSKEDLSSKLSISKKSKTIKRRTKKITGVKNEHGQQNDVWNINSVFSNIFAYIEHKDLIEFNAVCKKWNQLSNPIIHKTIKLNRSWNIIKNSHDKKLNKYGKIDADVAECISNNAKHAQFIKELNYNYKLEPQRAIEVFETFRFISKLTIESYDMSQDQFLGMISPLTQLQELTLKSLAIKKVIYKRLYKEVVQLPSTLNKLSLSIRLTGNPELFIKTINSHNNLVEFDNLSSNDVFLEPFYKPYPSLVKFEYRNHLIQSPQSLINVFEQNHQLISLKLTLNYWNSELANCINGYLSNLEELNISEYNLYGVDQSDINLKFSQSTKIKKLNLSWRRLTDCSIDSILLKCPCLEELGLNRHMNFQRPGIELSFDFTKPGNIKKLNINCQNLSGPIFDAILLKCINLNELVVILPVEWKRTMKSIYEKCANLQKLDISPRDNMWGQEKDTFSQEFYKSELFTGKFRIKSTLTHIILNRFEAVNSKAENFKNFENLKSISYPIQTKIYKSKGERISIDMELWPGYNVGLKHKDAWCDDIEFNKIHS